MGNTDNHICNFIIFDGSDSFFYSFYRVFKIQRTIRNTSFGIDTKNTDNGNVDAIFEEGYRSAIKIAIFFLLVAAVYPKLGFITRTLEIDKSWNEIRETAVNYMAENHYEIESETPDMVTFRIKGTVGRLTKMYEDRITFTRTGQGWNLEGLRKDAFRLASGLENRLS